MLPADPCLFPWHLNFAGSSLVNIFGLLVFWYFHRIAPSKKGVGVTKTRLSRRCVANNGCIQFITVHNFNLMYVWGTSMPCMYVFSFENITVYIQVNLRVWPQGFRLSQTVPSHWCWQTAPMAALPKSCRAHLVSTVHFTEDQFWACCLTWLQRVIGPRLLI